LTGAFALDSLTQSVNSDAMLQVSTKILFLCFGHLFLFLAVLGIFLPLLPTTPFLLLAAFSYSKGSSRMHQWLIQQPRLGPLINDWNRYGVIRLRAKIWSTALIVPLFSYTLLFVRVGTTIKSVVAMIGCAVLCFIWSRPSNPKT
jgi:uncharacterized membrane protein YbaN (DUF454 family)